MTGRIIRHLGQPWEDVGEIDVTLRAESGAHAEDRATLWATRTFGPSYLQWVLVYDLGPLAPCSVPGCGHQPTGRTYRVVARRLEPR